MKMFGSFLYRAGWSLFIVGIGAAIMRSAAWRGGDVVAMILTPIAVSILGFASMIFGASILHKLDKPKP